MEVDVRLCSQCRQGCEGLLAPDTWLPAETPDTFGHLFAKLAARVCMAVAEVANIFAQRNISVLNDSVGIVSLMLFAEGVVS